jgi:2-phospho-L-lactate transferase/gluconeogenesis factor (CofD/UPF0052 family)
VSVAHEPSPLRVVLFSGGRGSGALGSTLVQTPGVILTVAINGYDDGASTGEVRRFLGDALGPSDFRKNASRLAAELASCPPALVRLLDRRLPVEGSRSALDAVVTALRSSAPADDDVRSVPVPVRAAVAERLDAFLALLDRGGAFDFDDCSVGNLVFAGGYLLVSRQFNGAVDDYAALLGLPPGLIENVTDGTNAFLVAVDVDGAVLGREADIVDATRRNRIRDIFLLPQPLPDTETESLSRAGADAAVSRLRAASIAPAINTRLLPRLAEADLIVYAPGTQHSSLFPSYLTAGLSEAIAANTHAVKLLITNIQSDAEIAGSSAVDLIERAVYYLKAKGRLTTPTPALVTHYLLNDPQGTAASDTYVPLGRLDALQDPRLVRVGQYEQSGSGRHDAAKVLGPYVASVLSRRRDRRQVAVLLHEAGSADKIAQTLLEMVRGGLADQPADVTVFCETSAPLDRAFVTSLPFQVRETGSLSNAAEDRRLREALVRDGFEYLVLAESSGMYNGEDVPWLISHLVAGRLDAVWGSRRLSVRDIEASYRLKYRHRSWLGAASYAGSHILSLAYLLLYGRYVSDTLSGLRALRVSDLEAVPVRLDHKQLNFHLLSRLLGRKAEMFEVPVHFYSLSPDRVRRTTVGDGLAALGTIVWAWLTPAPVEPLHAPDKARDSVRSEP